MPANVRGVAAGLGDDWGSARFNHSQGAAVGLAFLALITWLTQWRLVVMHLDGFLGNLTDSASLQNLLPPAWEISRHTLNG